MNKRLSLTEEVHIFASDYRLTCEHVQIHNYSLTDYRKRSIRNSPLDFDADLSPNRPTDFVTRCYVICRSTLESDTVVNIDTL